jgi:hypothetical protein
MFCKNCGNQVKDGASFCNNCGAAIVKATETPVQPAAENTVKTNAPVCPDCGNPVNAESKFCKNCGATITMESKPAAMPEVQSTPVQEVQSPPPPIIPPRTVQPQPVQTEQQVKKSGSKALKGILIGFGGLIATVIVLCVCLYFFNDDFRKGFQKGFKGETGEVAESVAAVTDATDYSWLIGQWAEGINMDGDIFLELHQDGSFYWTDDMSCSAEGQYYISGDMLVLKGKKICEDGDNDLNYKGAIKITGHSLAGFNRYEYVTHDSEQIMAKIDDKDGWTNIREGKGRNYRIIDKLYDNELFIVEDTSGEWWPVVKNNGLRGFVHKSCIKIVSGRGSSTQTRETE